MDAIITTSVKLRFVVNKINFGMKRIDFEINKNF